MIDKNLNFVEKYVRGLAAEEDIMLHIAAWHGEDDCVLTLPEFLGITEEEHLAFVEDEKMLGTILRQYRANYLRKQFKLIICNDELEKSA